VGPVGVFDEGHVDRDLALARVDDRHVVEGGAFHLEHYRRPLRAFGFDLSLGDVAVEPVVDRLGDQLFAVVLGGLVLRPERGGGVIVELYRVALLGRTLLLRRAARGRL